MLPSLTGGDHVNEGDADAKVGGYRAEDLASCTAAPNLGHLGIGQAGARMGFTTAQALSSNGAAYEGSTSFLAAVARVVSLGSEEEVLRIDAEAVVAVVKHAEAGRDWPLGQLPCDSVRAERRPTATDLHFKGAVAGVAPTSGPIPTAIGMRDFLPKAFGQWSRRWSRHPLHDSYSSTTETA